MAKILISIEIIRNFINKFMMNNSNRDSWDPSPITKILLL